jgi:flagellin
MSLRINTNVSALTAYQNLSKNQNDRANSIEKLSSGLTCRPRSPTSPPPGRT